MSTVTNFTPRSQVGKIYRKMFDFLWQAENNAGSCRYSPDLIKQGVECISCIACAKCLLYHCHYEDENFTGGNCRLGWLRY